MNAASQGYPSRPFTQGGASTKLPDRSAYSRLGGQPHGGQAGASLQQPQQQQPPQQQASQQLAQQQNPPGPGASMREEYFTQLSEEQRDEINEAVCPFPSRHPLPEHGKSS